MSMADDDRKQEDVFFILTDAEGNEREFVLLGTVTVDDGYFVLLTPTDAEENAESTEIFMFHYDTDEDGDETFSVIEDEKTFSRVRAAAEAYLASQGVQFD